MCNRKINCILHSFRQFQILLTDYLDIQNNSNEENAAAAFADQNTGINSFFSRRKMQT